MQNRQINQYVAKNKKNYERILQKLDAQRKQLQ